MKSDKHKGRREHRHHHADGERMEHHHGEGEKRMKRHLAEGEITMERHHREGERPFPDGERPKDRHHHRGAKTFRRGRAIAFLERMELKRDTLKKQLETPELQSINPILVGELKAVETVIDEFVQLFELYEFEEGKELDSENGTKKEQTQ